MDKRKQTVKYVSRKPGIAGWFTNFPKHLNVTTQKTSLALPENFAHGYAKVWQISDGLTCRLVDYRLNADFSYAEPAARTRFLIIYLYCYRNCAHLKYTINDRTIVEGEDFDFSSLLMTNSSVNQRFELTKGASVRGLTIELKKEWLTEKMNPASGVNLEILEQRDVFQTMIKPAYRVLINEIFQPDPRLHMPELYMSSRVLKLLELFFDDIFTNGLDANILPASARDVENLMTIEQYLRQHYRGPFPTITSLSRMAMMSGTKLKLTFKKAFGTTLFEYFQRNRMAKAKELLQSNQHTVTEVGEMLGYKNMSNFSTAFRKEFNVLPKDAAGLD